MEHAERELARGVRELPGVQHNTRILEYHDATSLRATNDEVPWCSSFVNWCLQHAGYEGTQSAVARSWLRWGEELDRPTYGCITVLSRPGNPWQGHVGFYTDHRHDAVLLLGGNQSNAVSIAAYDPSRVLSYRWPKTR
jgi:uncharacterized protein (TIGR02594 family)